MQRPQEIAGLAFTTHRARRAPVCTCDGPRRGEQAFGRRPRRSRVEAGVPYRCRPGWQSGCGEGGRPHPRVNRSGAAPIADLAFTTAPGEIRCLVHVRRTKARRAGVWKSTRPKSRRSRRSVPLPPRLAERMRAYVADHPHADDPAAPFWPSRGVGGARSAG